MKPSDFHLAISGSFGAMDIGDEAMLTEDLHYVLETVGIPRENIYLFGWQPEYMVRYHKHPMQNCFSSAELKKLARRRDSQKANRKKKALSEESHLQPFVDRSHALLITGGGTINTREEAGYSVRRMHSIVSYFCKAQKPVFMSGQTIGPLGEVAEHDQLAKEIVESVDCLTVRDSLYSRRYLEIIGAHPQEFIETIDDAYTLPYQDEKLPADTASFVEDGNCVALNITQYTSDTTEQRNFVARLGEQIITQFDTKLVLVSHTPLDFGRLWMIYDSIPNALKHRVWLPDTRQWRDAMLKKLISHCRLAIGGRYHFIVFAGTSNTPFVGMAGNHYSYIKQDGFARPLGLENSILTEPETWDFDCVMDRIRQNLDAKLGLQDKFPRPSVSMQRFGKWLQEKFGLQVGTSSTQQGDSAVAATD